jgi:hypothetical protein
MHTSNTISTEKKPQALSYPQSMGLLAKASAEPSTGLHDIFPRTTWTTEDFTSETMTVKDIL